MTVTVISSNGPWTQSLTDQTPVAVVVGAENSPAVQERLRTLQNATNAQGFIFTTHELQLEGSPL